MADDPDIASARLGPDDYARNFADIDPPLDGHGALVEASRCYFCHDAPCVEACPTGIDVPGFIRKIASGNLRGAALDILTENIMGGACARVCPTEVLCEQACVRTAEEAKPVAIGRLQRHATDFLMAEGGQPFARAPSSGKRVAVVGAGPAGLAAAHGLAMRGHDVVAFEARAKAGGLNEYGIAAYKVADDFAAREVDFILGIGGIELCLGRALGRGLTLPALCRDYDAVFLGLGQAGVKALGLAGEDLDGVIDAVAYIARLRQAGDLAELPVGRRVVVIGGGNTAVDIAVQSRRLGAEQVTLVYRRGPDAMSATDHERDFAQVNGVTIRYWARPVGLMGESGRLTAVEFKTTGPDEAGRRFRLEADMAFKAIGQMFLPAPLEAGAAELLEIADGRIAVDDTGRTSLPGVWAGGDCVAGADLTVQAVQDGKRAAAAIDRFLTAKGDGADG